MTKSIKEFHKTRKQQRARIERIVAMVGNGKSKAEVGRHFKISRQRVEQIVKAESKKQAAGE